MRRTGENASIKGEEGNPKEEKPKGEKILLLGLIPRRDLSNHICVRLSYTGQIHLRMGFHENPD